MLLLKTTLLSLLFFGYLWFSPELDETARRKKSDEIASPIRNTFCGAWTPHGNLGNESYNGQTTVPLGIGLCRKNATTTTFLSVGKEFVPDTSTLHCSPTLTDRRPAVLALDMQSVQPQVPEFSLIIPSFMGSSVLQRSIPKICEHTAGIYEFVFIIDGSYDDSLQALKDILLSEACASMERARILVTPSSVFETSSDNLGYSLASPSHFYLEVQADMMILEDKWNLELVRPIYEDLNIFSVSGRCGHPQPTSLLVMIAGVMFGWTVGRCSYSVEKPSKTLARDTANAFYITATNNRGPLVYRADVLQSLGYLDEANFVLGEDDHDLNRRALLQNWKTAYKYVDFYSPLELSPQRNPDIKDMVPESVRTADRQYLESRQESSQTDCDPALHIYSPQTPYASRKLPIQRYRASDLTSPLPPLPIQSSEK